MIKIKYLYLAGIISCFIGEIYTVRVFGLFELFPLRLILILAIPLILIKPYKGKSRIWRFAVRLFIGMFIYGITSLIWSPDPLLGLRQFQLLFVGVMIFFLVSHYVKDISSLKNIMIIWSIVSVISSLLAFYEIINGEYLFSHVTDYGAWNIELTRILSIGWLTPRVFFPGPNEFAFFNSISALLMLGWAFETQKTYRVVAFIATSLSIILVINSFSRAAIFGLIIGLLFFMFILSTKTKFYFRFFSISLILCISIYAIYSGKKFIDNNLALTMLVNKIENDPNSIRIKYYNSAIVEGTIGSFGFGRGLGASSEIIDGGSYHHYLLEILAEFGFWIFLGYLTLMAKICIQLRRAIKHRRYVFWSAGLLASCIAFPVLCAGPASLSYLYPFWLWLAFIIAYTDYDFSLMTNKSNKVVL